LKHPFYQAWSAGRLPLAALRTYAREYGAFIDSLPVGWEALQDEETAQEERQHAALWRQFGAALGADAGPATIAQSRALAATAATLYSSPATALGALYAFESQQPATAQSKLAGLRDFYTLPQSVEPYFELHSRNQHEAAKLLAQIEALAPEPRERAFEACESMSRSLWEALSGIYDQECSPGPGASP
jgi:pyrroloquinoline-quinone synthase